MAVSGDMAQSAKMHHYKLYASTENEHEIWMPLPRIYSKRHTSYLFNNHELMSHTYIPVLHKA